MNSMEIIKNQTYDIKGISFERLELICQGLEEVANAYTDDRATAKELINVFEEAMR